MKKKEILICSNHYHLWYKNFYLGIGVCELLNDKYVFSQEYDADAQDGYFYPREKCIILVYDYWELASDDDIRWHNN
jgi:hypothetical protein